MIVRLLNTSLWESADHAGSAHTASLTEAAKKEMLTSQISDGRMRSSAT